MKPIKATETLCCLFIHTIRIKRSILFALVPKPFWELFCYCTDENDTRTLLISFEYSVLLCQRQRFVFHCEVSTMKIVFITIMLITYASLYISKALLLDVEILHEKFSDSCRRKVPVTLLQIWTRCSTSASLKEANLLPHAN